MENAKTKKRKCGLFRKMAIGMGTIGAAANMCAVTASASFGESVSLKVDGETDASAMMGKIIGILLTITRFVGIALVVYGVYEVVMSFMQNQPEAKTKGIIMALAGVVMTGLKSILKAIGLVQ